MAELSVTEYAVLGVLSEKPIHGFALSKALEAGSDVGRILTVRRPLVYRALDRLVDNGLAEPVQTERGDAGPNRVIHRATRRGHRQLQKWLGQPVDHIRDIRIELLLKLALLHRSGQSPIPLIETQRQSLAPRMEALDTPATGDHVEIWRRHNARAAGSFLDELSRIYGG